MEIDELAKAVIAAAIEVHRCLGPGFLEAVYEEALCIELGIRGVPLERQVIVSVDYKGNRIGAARLDLLIRGGLIVEVKAVDALAPIHIAQVLSYLRATDLSLGLLINFNVGVLMRGVKRVVRSL